MADLAAKKVIPAEDQQDWRRIRITLTSRNVKNVEEGLIIYLITYIMDIIYYFGYFLYWKLI